MQNQVTLWIREVLSEKNFEKIKVKFPDSVCKGGYVAEMVLADVVAEKNGNTSNIYLVIKKNKKSEVLLQEMNLKEGYINEINVYSKFLPYLKKFAEERNSSAFNNLPYCYGTINKPMEYVVLLENLNQVGFKVHEMKTPQDRKHVKLVLAAYAKWHALWFAVKDQEPKDFEELTKYNVISSESKIFDFIAETMKQTFDFIIELYTRKNNLEFVKKLKVFSDNNKKFYLDSLGSKENDYSIIRHGDTWNNNYLFHYNERETVPDNVAIIDWQLATLGSPALDLILYLFNCCSRKELDHLDSLLKFYYDNFSIKMKELGSDSTKCFPFEALLSSFKKFVPCAIVTMPFFSKLGFIDDSRKDYDITIEEDDANAEAQLNQELTDPEGYFKRVNGILEFCIERGLM